MILYFCGGAACFGPVLPRTAPVSVNLSSAMKTIVPLSECPSLFLSISQQRPAGSLGGCRRRRPPWPHRIRGDAAAQGPCPALGVGSTTSSSPRVTLPPWGSAALAAPLSSCACWHCPGSPPGPFPTAPPARLQPPPAPPACQRVRGHPWGSCRQRLCCPHPQLPEWHPRALPPPPGGPCVPERWQGRDAQAGSALSRGGGAPTVQHPPCGVPGRAWGGGRGWILGAAGAGGKDDEALPWCDPD